ncbi:MAG TPA: LuxR C-terminal-related transcriptional regulator [Solirubrobacteraceae bacterium]|nr:LuxR C-terminal-related transcriptional regulator [Solirubrobacteraceae bacterium]
MSSPGAAQGPVRVALLDRGAGTAELEDVLASAGYELSSGSEEEPEVTVVVAVRSNRQLVDLVAQTSRRSAHVVVVCERFGSSASRLLLAAGAAGLVQQERAARSLVPTIEAVRAGQITVPSRRALSGVQPGLSTREKQVMGLVALGFSNGEIASRLFVAESTVKSHLSSAFGKLGVRSRHEAVDLIVNPAFGLSIGIMSLGAAPIDSEPLPGGGPSHDRAG